MNLKLESVDAVYDISTDRLSIIENYVPTEEPTAVVLLQLARGDDVTWAQRKLIMSQGQFKRQKALWDIDGVVVRNGAGKIIAKGEVV